MRAFLYRLDIAADSLAHLIFLRGHALFVRHERLVLAQVQNHIRAIEAPDRAAHDLARAILEFLVDHFLLDLADALHHRLLSGLGSDAAEVFRCYLHFDSFTNLRVYNNRFLRCDYETAQFGQLDEGSQIDHNIFAFGALKRLDQFTQGQDNNVQISVRNGAVSFHHNVVLGAARQQ